jgi:uncharacterized membrane protein YgcG
MELGWRSVGRFVLFALAAGGLPPADFAAAADLPTLTARVTDRTGTLKRDEIVLLERKLEAFESRRGSQLAVVIVATTEPDSIEQYAVALFEKNALGRKGKDDGALLLIAKDDRAARIEVGYGLEGTLTDLHSSRILDEQLVPAFRAGDFRGGIERTTDAMIARIDSETDALDIASAPAAAPIPATSAAPAASPAADATPASNDYVHDPDGQLPGWRFKALTDKLSAFEARTRHRMALVVLSDSPEPLPEYAKAALARHPIGQSGTDDYLMVFTTTDDDRVEILVGDALKWRVSAVERQRVVSEILVPRLWAGKPYEALDFAADTLIARIDGRPLPADPLTPRAPAASIATSGAAPGAGVAAAIQAFFLARREIVPEALFGGGMMIAAACGALGLVFGGFLLWTPRSVRGSIAAVAAAAFLVWFGRREDFAIPLIGYAWGAFVAGLVAYRANAKWFEGGGGGGGGSSRSSSRSSSSSGRSWSGGGGRSGGGGASKRW